MSSILDQYKTSTLGLIANGIKEPQRNESLWGYKESNGGLEPELSKLHFEYSAYGDPSVTPVNFNKNTTLSSPSTLDELDPLAPKLTPMGVVSQVYNSGIGNKYTDKGPAEGRF